MHPLEIAPFFNKQMNCLEGVIAALANHAGDPYTMLCAESWGFKYIDRLEAPPLIGLKIRADIPNKKRFLESDNGIMVQDRELSAEPALEWMLAQLSEARPVILRIDSYWCPWNEVYQKQSIRHYVIVTHFDREAQSFHCMDPMVQKAGILRLPLSHYYKGYKSCLTYSRVPVVGEGTSLREVLLHTVNGLMGNGRETSAFEDMEKLAGEIQTTSRFKDETTGYPVIGTAPLIFNLVWIAKGRLNYADFLVHLFDKHGVVELKAWADEIRQAGKEWMLVSAVAAKLLMQKESTSIQRSIADRIRNVALREQSVHQEICGFLGLSHEAEGATKRCCDLG